MTRFEIWLDLNHVAGLEHDAADDQFAIEYTPEWIAAVGRYPVSPALAFDHSESSRATRSRDVRWFLENLMPEGQALDDVAWRLRIMKTDIRALVATLGAEMSGAVRILAPGSRSAAETRALVEATARGEKPNEQPTGNDRRRVLGPDELSQLIRDRPERSLAVIDGKVRLSIAGFQDKLGVYEEDGVWHLVEGPWLGSTHILKPAPVRAGWQGLPGNEYLCMQLAQAAGIGVAQTRLVHVPEPVLVVDRFDRAVQEGRVQRLHVIDGCQLLGLPAARKFERDFGDGVDVKDLRDGVTYAKLIAAIDRWSAAPLREKESLLRWVIFQVLIGNCDAHGKNVSFFWDDAGLRLAPAYDLVSIEAIKWDEVHDTYAIAIGDAFKASELSAFEWGAFAHQCGLQFKRVAQVMETVSQKVRAGLPAAVEKAKGAGVADEIVGSIEAVVVERCGSVQAMAGGVRGAKAADYV